MLPQPKTNQFIELINAHNIAGTTFTDFEGAAYKRDVSKLPEKYDQALMLALYYAIQRDAANTKKHFEEALICSGYDVSICDNYLMALQSLYLYKEMYAKSIELVHQIQSPQLEYQALISSLCFLDIEQSSLHFDAIERMNCSDNLDGFNNLIGISMNLNEFCKAKNIPSDTMKQLGKITHECLEKFNIHRIGQTISHQPERPNLAINYKCDSARCTTDDILDMNDYFIDKLIENELDELPVVVTFSRKSMS